MWNDTEKPTPETGNTRAWRRRSTLRKLVSINPERTGFIPRRKNMSIFAWIAGILGLAGASALTAIFVLTGALIFGAISILSGFAASLPPADQLSNIRIDQSTKIYDRNGALLYEIVDPKGGRRTIVSLKDIPTSVKAATIATEDPTFYSNPGVDPQGIARAFYFTFFKGDLQGGSTITQQLVKNNLLTNEVSFDRKVREALLSLEVTQKYSKDEILQAYLNTNYYGNLSYGIEAAAESYFGKEAKDLNLAEASLLAGLPQQPAKYDPCQDADAAVNRQKDVLHRMVVSGYISENKVDPSVKEMEDYFASDAFKAQCNPPMSTVAPHFVDYVRQVLEQRYGTDVTYKGGLQVYTTLDPAVQKIAEEEARKQIAQLKAQHVTNAAVVVMNPQDGEILAMLGSVDFFDKSIDGQVNVATAPRQPGSSIKPFNYLAAFRKGWTPATPILDAPTRFIQGAGLPPYIPVNYDGKFHGIVNVRAALQNSLNVPAVRTLYFVGVNNLADQEQQFGVTTLQDPSRYGLAMTLGGAEVTLLEHTGAFATLANYGKRMPPTPFLKILDGTGKVIYDQQKNPPAGQQVVDPGLAYLVTNILTDNTSRIPEFGPASPLHLCANGSANCTAANERPIAAKTGTTNDFRDNWTLGYTPELTVGVWVGNADNTPMIKSTGITGAAPIWHNVFARIYKEIAPYNGVAPHPFPQPANVVRVAVCKESGMLPGSSCPPGHTYTEAFVTSNAPAETDKFWSGAWGNTCVPTGKVPALGTKIDVKYTGGIPLYDDIVKQTVAKGMPQGLAGLGMCTPVGPDGQPEQAPAADNQKPDNQPPPPQPPKKHGGKKKP